MFSALYAARWIVFPREANRIFGHSAVSMFFGAIPMGPDVGIPPDRNTTAAYAGAVVKGAPHKQAAKLWLAIVHSPQALSIFERYGFKPYTGKAPTN